MFVRCLQTDSLMEVQLGGISGLRDGREVFSVKKIGHRERRKGTKRWGQRRCGEASD